MDEIKAVKVEIACQVMIQTEKEEACITVYARDPKAAITKATKIYLDGKEKREKAVKESPKVKKAKESLKKASDEAANEAVPDIPSEPLPDPKKEAKTDTKA